MISDVYMIFITALAVFGLYCIAENIMMHINCRNGAKTVVLVVYDESKNVYGTVDYLHNNIFNCNIMVVAEEENICPMAGCVTVEDLHQYITNDLFTKN